MISNSEHLDPDRNEIPTMDVQYFSDKFSAIPDEQWTRIKFERDGRCCVLGHCGVRSFGPIVTPESRALNKLFNEHGLNPVVINDFVSNQFPQTMPKARILAALEYIKSL